MPDSEAAPVHIDFVGDVVCPWCFLGWKRLHDAMARRPDLKPDIAWRPYQLRFEIPEGGMPYSAYMKSIFPDPAHRRAMDQRLIDMGAAEGLDFRLDLIAMRPNTNAAHRLIRWAGTMELGEQAAEAVMRAYFTQGRDIGDPEVLIAIAGEIGMNGADVKTALDSGQDKAAIDEECRMAAQAGINGVPFTIMANKVALSGAETPERLLMALDQALSG